jgi:superfamily II DNA/RNA helicase
VLRALIDNEGDACTNAIVFCNRKVDVDIVAKSLKKYGYDAAPIHGDLEQSQRTRTLDAFRAGELKILIASDVAARGLDVPAVSHVYNFDVPGHPEDYVHRIGRTGRAGRSGKALTICNPRDEKALAAVEALIQREIARLPDPTGGSAPAPEGTPEEAPERAPRPSRSRSRSRSVSRKDAAPAETPEAMPAEVVPQERAEEARPPAQTETRPTNRSETRPKERGESRGEERRENRGQRRDDSGPRVVGMGDHLPGFIALSFDERRAG